MAKIKKLLNKYWKQLIVPGLILLVSIIGITYAYFSIQVNGNDEASSMVVTTASLILNYIDGPEVTLDGAYPGASVEKEVKVQNIGTVGVTYAIGFVNMENTFQNDELLVSYTCKSYENFGEAGEVESGECYPLSPQPIDQSQPGIEEGIFIGVGITQVYQIKIEFLETGSNQNYNQNANFSGLINIGETLDAFTLVAQVLYENNAPCEGCDVEVNPEEGVGQGGFLLPENGYTVTRLSSNIIALNTTIKPRSATTDSEGLFIMPKVAQGIHEIVVKDSLGNLVMSGGIEVSVAPEPSVSGTTITGKKGEEIVAILLQANGSTKAIKTMSLLDYPTLTVVMNGGTTSQTFENRYLSGDQITLIDPTKEDYDFNGWTVSGTGSTIVNGILTVGTEDIILTANWDELPPLMAYAGGNQSYYIDSKGNLWVFGNNQYGQLGNNTTVSSRAAIKITNSDGTKFKSLASSGGLFFMLGLDKNNNLWSWGDNGDGQLGNNTTTQSNVPIKITNSAGTYFTKITAGYYHSMGIDQNGDLWTWGDNSKSQLGNNSTTDSKIPIKITNTSGTKFVDIAAGYYHSLAIDTNGDLWAWGYNNNKQLGNNSTTTSGVPIKITNSSGTKFVDIAAGQYHSYAIDTNGDLWTWGYNTNGQLGNNSTTTSGVPIKITNSSGTKFVSLAPTVNCSSAAIDTNGDLWIWGYNYYGQIGNNSTTDARIPIKLTVSGVSNFISVTLGYNHSMAVDDNDNLWVWGYNNSGQLGNNGIYDSHVPISVIQAKLTKVASNSTSGFALDTSGNIWSWGYNNYSQLGDNSTTTKSTPVKIINSDGAKIVKISSGIIGEHSLALDENDNLWAWGLNQYGQLGDNSTTTSKIPKKITNSSGTKFTQIAAGATHSLGIDTNGDLWTWGNNQYGQLGNNTQNSSSIPIKITNSDGTDFVKIAAGRFHSLAIDTNGNLWTWGYNNYGQLGNNTQTFSKVPIKITNSDGTKFVSIFLTTDHSMAIDEVGNFWIWGDGAYAQLGNNTQTASKVLIKITNSDGTKFVKAIGGTYHVLAIDEVGNLWTWGYNNYGQLGNNTQTTSKVPLKITNTDGTKFVDVATGNYHSYAIDTNGNTWTWGYNNNYQLGNSGVATVLVPSRIFMIYLR